MESVKIGGLVYQITEIEDLAHEERTPGLMGCVDYHQLTIKLEKNLHKKVQEQTLVHEIVHGIFAESGYESHEEEQVNRIAKTLYQVLIDNDFTFLKREDE